MEPTVGRIVHYRLGDGQIRPAIIVRVFNPTCVNLRVFLDGTNDAGVAHAHEWKTSVLEGTDAGQWSWPPRA